MKRLLILCVLVFTLVSFNDIDNKEYPTPPETKERLFYIQRNHNTNTIVYDANFDEKGQLKDDKPIDVYWIRYEEEGQIMDLRRIEKWYAYGVKCSKPKSGENYYKVKLVADKKRDFKLIQSNPYEAYVVTLINNVESYLEHMYIQADNSGVWPKVKYIELFGIDAKNGATTYEKIFTK